MLNQIFLVGLFINAIHWGILSIRMSCVDQWRCMRWINGNIKYPQTSIEMNEQGRVFLSFVVEEGWLNHECKSGKRCQSRPRQRS